MKKRGYLILGIFVVVLSIVLVLAAEGFLTNSNGFWKFTNGTIVNSQTINLNSSQLEGAFGGSSVLGGPNNFKSYVSIGLPTYIESTQYLVYFEIYEKDNVIDTPGEDGYNDPIRVGNNNLTGILECDPNSLASYVISSWEISLNDINNAGTEADGIYEFYYKVIYYEISTLEEFEKTYNNTILNINIIWDNVTIIEDLSSTWYDFSLNPIEIAKFDSVDLTNPTPSIDNSLYFELTGFPKTSVGQKVNVEIYENDSVDGLTDDAIRTDTISLEGTIDADGKVMVLWKLTEEDIIAAETEDQYEFYAKINVLGEEISFKDYPVFVEVTDTPATYLDNANAEWRNEQGTYQLFTWEYLDGQPNNVVIYATSIGASVGTEVTFEVFEDDAIGRDNIRTIATGNPLTGTVNAAGIAFTLWTITADDLANSGAGGSEANPWEYYFKLNISSEEKEFATEILQVVNARGGECINVNFCGDYGTLGDCGTDECNVTISIPDINCSAEDFTCFCEWNETAGKCGAAWTTTEVDPPVWGPMVVGMCSYNEDSGTDNCDDGYLSYSWESNWTWDGGNIYATEAECLAAIDTTSGCIQDILGWHYDPENKYTLCAGGENTITCPAQVQLTYGNWINWVVAVAVILIIYFLIFHFKKKNKKKDVKKIKKK